MLDASSVFYMDKIVTGPEGVGVVDLPQSIGDNIRELAKAKGKPVGEIRVAVLDRPRHEELIEEIRAAGAGTRLMLDGDVAGGINAARYESRIDMCVGIGGSPEGITTACAIKALGGFMQGQLRAEGRRGARSGASPPASTSTSVLRAPTTWSRATTRSSSRPASPTAGWWRACAARARSSAPSRSCCARKSGTIRRVIADHLAEKWLEPDQL